MSPCNYNGDLLVTRDFYQQLCISKSDFWVLVKRSTILCIPYCVYTEQKYERLQSKISQDKLFYLKLLPRKIGSWIYKIEFSINTFQNNIT